jgi:UDP-2,3-diacylglucosamine pyrophosphatase LpxH
MITLILSDLHLGARNSRTDLLAQVLRTDFDRLILNGDTIDSLNFGRFRRGDWRVADLLKGIARERELVLIRGNHDGWVDQDQPGFGSLDVLAELLDAPMREEYELEVGESRYLVLHGDQFDHTLNLTWVGHAADWFYNRIQRISRPTARWLKGRVKSWGGVVASVRRGAISYAQQSGCTGVITGHTHYDDDNWVGETRYMNTGCWVDHPCSYIRVEDGVARLAYWGEATVRQTERQLELVGAR